MPKLLTIAEVAQLLRVGEARAYSLIRENRLPGVVRLGRQVRVNETTLLAFIEEGGAALPGGWRKEPEPA